MAHDIVHHVVMVALTESGAKERVIRKRGRVIETLPNATFRVELEDSSIVLAHISGRMRRYHIRVLAGDQVEIECSPYDISRGRIVYRYK